MEETSTQLSVAIELLDLPEEVLAIIVQYLRDRPSISLVSKRFHRVFWREFKFYKSDLEFVRLPIEDTRRLLESDRERAEKAVKGIETLVKAHQRNVRNLFACDTTAMLAFYLLVYLGDLDSVRQMLESPNRVNPARHNSLALLVAIQRERLDVVRLLLEDSRVNPSIGNNYILMWAAREGHAEVIRMLISDPRVDPAADNNYILRWAAQRGHSEIVKALLTHPKVDPSAEENYAIKWASTNGHIEVCRLLLADPRVSSASHDLSHAMMRASVYGHTEILRLLLQTRGDSLAANIASQLSSRSTQSRTTTIQENQSESSIRMVFYVVMGMSFLLISSVFLLYNIKDLQTVSLLGDFRIQNEL